MSSEHSPLRPVCGEDLRQEFFAQVQALREQGREQAADRLSLYRETFESYVLDVLRETAAGKQMPPDAPDVMRALCLEQADVGMLQDRLRRLVARALAFAERSRKYHLLMEPPFEASN